MYAGQDRRGRDHRASSSPRMRHPYSEALLASVPEARPGRLHPPVQHPRPPAGPVPAASPVPVRPPLPLRPERLPGHEPSPRRAGGLGEPGHLAACFHQVGVDEATMAPPRGGGQIGRRHRHGRRGLPSARRPGPTSSAQQPVLLEVDTW